VKMRKILTKLNVVVLNVLAEPVGAYILYYFRDWKLNRANVLNPGLPRVLQVVFVCDLGAGKLHLC
jgi:hypothetical protein